MLSNPGSGKAGEVGKGARGWWTDGRASRMRGNVQGDGGRRVW